MVLVSGFGSINISAEPDQSEQADIQIQDNLGFIPGEILIGFENDNYLTKKSTDFLKTDYNIFTVETSRNSYFSKAIVEPGKELEYCESIRNDPRVEYAEPNYINIVSVTPNDPMFNQQYGPQMIKCPDGWDITTGNSGVKIAVIDTGVDYNHPDLADNCIDGYDFVNINLAYYTSRGYKEDPGEDYIIRDDNPMDHNSHGTHCAGIASAVTDNGVGIAGVGWSCSIMPVRAGFSLLWPHEGTDYRVGVLEDEDIIDAIDYAADNGADVLSMSFGKSSSSSSIESACNRAWNKGCILVSSTGNDYRGSAGYPARYEKVIGVGAVDQNSKRCDFSNYGAGLSISAPGKSILSTIPGSGYDRYSGTSMACPHVAGVAGLAVSRYPSYSNQQIRDLLERTADYIGPELSYGEGLVDATFDEEAPPEEDEIVVTITMDYIEALDKIDTGSKAGEWYYELRVFDDYDDQTQVQTQIRYNKDYEYWLPIGWHSAEKWNIEDGAHVFSAYPGQSWVDISIRVYDWDGWSFSDIADISACPNDDGDWSWAIQNLEGREYAIRYYLDDNSVSIIPNPCEDKIEDGDYYIGNGEIDGSQGEESLDKLRQDDAKIRYTIDDNYNPPHSTGLDAIGFHDSYFGDDDPEWVEPNTDVKFTATVAGGAAPFTWELHYGDGETGGETTDSREFVKTHRYSLNNGKTRTLNSIPYIIVTDYLGEHSQKFYPTHMPGIHVTNKPNKAAGGKTGVNNAWAEATDPEGDKICYIFQWKDGSTTREPSSGYVSSGTHVEINRKSSSFSVFAVDESGAEGEKLTLSSPKPKIMNNPIYLFIRSIIDDFPLLKQLFSLITPET